MPVQNIGLGSTSLHFYPTNGLRNIKIIIICHRTYFWYCIWQHLNVCRLFQSRKTNENGLSVFISTQIPVQNINRYPLNFAVNVDIGDPANIKTAKILTKIQPPLGWVTSHWNYILDLKVANMSVTLYWHEHYTYFWLFMISYQVVLTSFSLKLKTFHIEEVIHYKPRIFKTTNIKTAKFKGCLYSWNRIPLFLQKLPQYF